MPGVSAIVVAAGRGTRMGAAMNKVYLPLAGKPVLSHTLALFQACPLVNEIIMVVHPQEVEYCRGQVVEPFGFTKVRQIVPGGKERQDSVMAGLHQGNRDNSLVVVHDGARPLLPPGVLENSIKKAQELGSVVVAVPVKDTIKRANQEGMVVETPDRSALWAVQTPQVFRRQWLLQAYAQAAESGKIFTDDGAVMEAAGFPVYLIPGSYSNLKITTPEDLILAEALLAHPSKSEG